MQKSADFNAMLYYSSVCGTAVHSLINFGFHSVSALPLACEFYVPIRGGNNYNLKQLKQYKFCSSFIITVYVQFLLTFI